MDPEEVALDAPVAELGRVVLVETELGRTFIEQSMRSGERRRLKAYLPDGRMVPLDGVPAERTLGDVAAAMTASRPLRAFQLPDSGIKPVYAPLRTIAAFLPSIIGILMIALGAFNQALGLVRFLILAVGIALVTVAADALNKSKRYRQWALEWEGGSAKAAELELPAPPDEIEVDDVKAEYGALLSDIVYRIERPALFDPQEPTSREFTLALLQWDNNDGVVGQDERREQARRVRATFVAAKANAERIGMAHIPEQQRPRATTALKAARLATDEAAPAPERETALRRAVEILDELALYYLPTGAETRRAITGHAPPQLPGRRSR